MEEFKPFIWVYDKNHDLKCFTQSRRAAKSLIYYYLCALASLREIIKGKFVVHPVRGKCKNFLIFEHVCTRLY